MKPHAAALVQLICASAVVAGDNVVDPRLADLDQMIEANPFPWLDQEGDGDPEGLALLIIQDGEVIFRKLYHGFTADRVVPIASSSKWVSGVGVLDAVLDPQIPQITLNTRISEYVDPFWESVARGSGVPVFDKREITIAQCFAHLSGLPNDGVPDYHQWAQLTHEAAVEGIATFELVGPPGEQIHYGGQGMHAAGLAVEYAVEQDHWIDFMRDTVFTPLGMANTDYFAFVEPGETTENPTVAGSVQTTLHDYEQLLRAMQLDGFYGGTQVLQPGLLELLLRDYGGPGVVIDRTPYRIYEPFAEGVINNRTGFGCFVDPRRERPTKAIPMRFAQSAGTWGTSGFIDLDRRLVGVLLAFQDDKRFDPNQPRDKQEPFNPSNRAFVEWVWPEIEAAIVPFCGEGDVEAPFGVIDAADTIRVISEIEAGENWAFDYTREGSHNFFDVLWHLERADAGCDADIVITDELASDGPLEISVTDVVLDDAARDRDVPVRVHAPASEGPEEEWPVVLISHGGGESASAMDWIGRHLATHGYVAAAITHPGSDRAWVDLFLALGIPYQFAFIDIEATFGPRPEDLSFVLDWLAGGGAGMAVDLNAVAVLGHCMGATTAFSGAGLTADMPDGGLVRFIDERVDAVVALGPQFGNQSGQGLFDGSWVTVETPALVVTGTDDFLWDERVRADPSIREKPYTELETSKYLVEIAGAAHNAFTNSEPYYPAPDRDERHHDWLQASVTAFLDWTLKDDEASRHWLASERLSADTLREVRQASSVP